MINYKYKFILILLPKTGTTSIVNLEKKNHPMFKDVDVKNNINKHYIVENHCRPGKERTPIRPELKETLSDGGLNYLKIATCRNPFSRVVSVWKYWNKRLINSKKPTAGFSYFVKNYAKMQKKIGSIHGKPNEIHFYTCVDSIALSTDNHLTYTDIDFWIKTENLQHDFNVVCDKLKFPHQKLPYKNATKHKHYTEYYDDETRQIVAEKHAKDIEYFGYKFGE